MHTVAMAVCYAPGVRHLLVAFVLAWLPTDAAQTEPKHYACHHAAIPLVIDGHIDDTEWQELPPPAGG